jgi:hypothetical protein
MFNVGSKQISQKTCKHTVWNLVSKSYQGPIKKYNDNITLISAIFSSVMKQARRKERVFTIPGILNRPSSSLIVYLDG